MKPEEIIEYVAKSYNVRPEILKSKSFIPYILEPRQTATYLLSRVFKIKAREIVKLLNTNNCRICIANKRIKKKLQDDDFKNFLNKILEGINTKAPPKELIFERDLKKFEASCTRKGDCLVTKTLMIFGSMLAEKYNITTACQLYYVLQNKKYPEIKNGRYKKMKQTCSTKNCVSHWVVEGGDEVNMVNMPVEQEEEVYLSPEEQLLHAVIRSAFEEKDVEYFKSLTFKKHLKILGVEKIQKTIDKFTNTV